MKLAETIKVDNDQLKELHQLVAQGEGLFLEFKRKAAHPDKIVKELIAFANTKGGTLLVGVDDDKSIPGVSYPDEELYVVEKAILDFCRPALEIKHQVIALSKKKFVLQFHVSQSEKRPYYFKTDEQRKESYIRYLDKTLKASREMKEIIRRSKEKRDIRFQYGEAEKALMIYLEQHSSITLKDFRRIAKLNLFKASRKLIILVLADVLKITPTEKGDLYSRF